MSRWTFEVDEQARSGLGQHNRQIEDVECWKILAAARQDFQLPPISLAMLDKNRASYYARAIHKGNGDRIIAQTPAGMTVLTILHEIAHHFPSGMNHGAPWVWAFFTLVGWFKSQDLCNRFSFEADYDEFC